MLKKLEYYADAYFESELQKGSSHLPRKYMCQRKAIENKHYVLSFTNDKRAPITHRSWVSVTFALLLSSGKAQIPRGWREQVVDVQVVIFLLHHK